MTLKDINTLEINDFELFYDKTIDRLNAKMQAQEEGMKKNG